MYRRATIYCAAILLATGGLATYATTPEPYDTEKIRTAQLTSYAHLDSGKQLLLFTSQAQRLAYKGDRALARQHLNEAMNAAARLPSSSATPISSGTPKEIHRVALITLKNGTKHRRMLVAEPVNLNAPFNFSAEALTLDNHDISDARVFYTAGGWDKATLLISLSNTLEAMESGRRGERLETGFAALHNEFLREDTLHEVHPRRAAQDHIALARTLLQLNAPAAARTALIQAEGHIASMEGRAEVDVIRSEMVEVNHLMETHEHPSPDMQIDQKLTQWWEALS